MPAFKKQERLKSQKQIDELFATGMVYFEYPFRALFLETYNTEDLVQVLITVSKKKYKNASARNRIKRLMREAYRLEKSYLYENRSIQGYLALIYIGGKEHDIKFLRKSMHRLLQKIDNS